MLLVAGAVDGASASLLRDGIVGGLLYRPRTLVVDATERTACDAAGLGALVDAVAVASAPERT